MEMFSLQDACNLLAINNRQLHKMLAIASIMPAIASNDKRRKVLTADQVEQLRTLRGAAPVAAPAASGDDLRRRLEALEREVRALRHELANLKGSRPLQVPLPVAQPLSEVDGEAALLVAGGLPPGYVGLAQFAQQYGIAETTLKKAVVTGRLACHKGRWKVGPAYVQYAFDEEEQRAVLAAYGRVGL